MTTHNLVLIDQSGQVPLPVLEQVAAALDIQAKRDLAEVWEVSAHVSAAQALTSGGAWPIYVVSELDLANAYGYHYIDDLGRPYAKILYRENWTITASHEMLEMLVNPQLDRYIATDIAANLEGDERFLVEIAGPVQSIAFGYEINGVLVSNFMYPSYFDLLVTEGKRYDFLGVIKKPRSILEGGYVSFLDNIGQWWQAFVTQNKTDLRRLATGTATNSPTADRLGRGFFYVVTSGVLMFIFYKIINNYATNHQRR